MAKNGLGTALGVALLALAACGRGGGNRSATALPGKNLLLVSIDTLRPDYTSPYGHAIETKTLQRLADEGVLFETALSPVPMTHPAHSSLFTGNYPGRHGVRDNVSYTLGDGAVTLAEVLRDAGYQTAAVVAAKVISRLSGLDQGFEFYDDHFTTAQLDTGLPTVERRAREVRESAQRWFAQRDKSKPFALFLHFYDPHLPHDPPEAMRARYASKPLDGEIVHVDRNIGTMLDQIEAEGLLEETLVVVVADHGESLGEHGEESHGLFLYEAATRIPMILRLPASAARRGLRVETPVALIDVMPTVLELLGVPAPGTDGVSLVRLIDGGELAPRVLFSETQYPLFYRWSPSYALREGGRKFIHSPKPELYDLQRDARELDNLAPREQEAVAKLQAAVEAQLARWNELQSTAEQASSHSLEELAALGYGGGAAVDGSSAGPLPDTKDRVHVYEDLAKAMDRMGAQKWDEARALFEAILERDPDNPSAHLNLAHVLASSGRLAEAEQHLRKCLELSPDNRPAKATLGMVFFSQQRLDEAEVLYRDILSGSPKSPEPLFFLGQIHERRGEPAKALECYEGVRALLPGMPGLEERTAAVKRALGAG